MENLTRGRAVARVRGGAEWAVWLMHSPMLAFWLITAIVVVGSVVDLFRAPRHLLEPLAAVTTMVGLTKLMAQVLGVAAWPTRRAHEALESADDD